MSRQQRVVRTAAATRRDRAVTVLAALLLAAMGLAAVLVGPQAEADQAPTAEPAYAPAATSSPNPGPAYPAAATATRYRGLAFDICTAPSRRAMEAWRASPYGAVGIYVSGRNRACTQPELTAAWVRDISAMGWKLLPINMGLQAPCRENKRKKPMKPASAAASGRTEAAEAVVAAKNLGLLPGSPIYADIEPYDPSKPRCVRAVAAYVSAWTRELHRHGYLSGLYGALSSGLADAAKRYNSKTDARPDAVWVARWDRSPRLTGWAGVPNNRWSASQRAKQYRGDHAETHGGVRMVIDSDSVDAPVATVARTYPVTSASTLNFRRSPGTSAEIVGSAEPGTEVAVVCQVSGPEVEGSRVWDKLVDGSYVSDAYVGGGARKPLPTCSYPVQVLTSGGAFTRTGPADTTPTAAKLPLGSLAWISCRQGTWVQLHNGLYLNRRHLAPYTAPLPNC
ncbi:glycoside hydrolase domain-containing protein [Sporichthya polymorpha]|uniref:glycoside hydrolase domain-containing protein n=1 Tax=Sporichthya polymorpha TaxID=35751 RepID=UPI00036AEFA2|nr:glycoside hydrolase domain-containing protein [Sporichthya polymorpha]